VIVEFVDDNRAEFGGEPNCDVLRDGCGIAPSTYYAAKSPPPSARAVRDVALKVEITRVFEANFSVYGADKLWARHLTDDPRVNRSIWYAFEARFAHRRSDLTIDTTVTSPESAANAIEGAFEG
jgi:hypothetical protein